MLKFQFDETTFLGATGQHFKKGDTVYAERTRLKDGWLLSRTKSRHSVFATVGSSFFENAHIVPAK